jgi:single-strand DNA-binding protein
LTTKKETEHKHHQASESPKNTNFENPNEGLPVNDLPF